MSENLPTSETTTEDEQQFAELDYHIQNLIAKNHPRIMNLELQIPYDYPWDTFLRKHFANPPFTITMEDYEYHIVNNKKIRKIKDSRQPTTFYSMLRFIEYFRKSLLFLEQNLKTIEAHYDKIRSTAEESSSVRGLLKNLSWSYDSISNKHEIFKKNQNMTQGLRNIMGSIEPLLANNLNITSRWLHLLNPMYVKVITHINNNFADGSFNLRLFHPIKTMSAYLAPYYTDAMKFAIELNEAIIQTTLFIKTNIKK